MDWLNWLIPLAAVFPLIYLLRIVLVMRALLGLRFGPARLTRVPLESVPAHIREAVARLDPVLREHGFAPDDGLHIVPHTGEAWAGYAVAYKHAADPLNLGLSPNPRADAAGGLIINLVTALAGGDELHTTNYQNENIIPAPRFMREEVIVGAEFPALLQRHRERVRATEAVGEHAVILPEAERVARGQARLDAMWQELNGSGLTRAEPDGRLAYRLGAAWQSARRLIRDEKARTKGKVRVAPGPGPGPGAEPPLLPLSAAAQVEFDYASYHQLKAVQAGRLAWLPKTLLMLVSLAVFALVLGWKLSVAGVAVLIVVLVFHECGHLFGMRWFGHRDTQLLFLPFLGGAAVAHDERVLKPWQHLVILFLGPLPGLFIGLALLAWAPMTNPLVEQFVWMLLGLNIFNLLPLLPLDGGQIMDTAFVTRFPAARVVFLALSGLGLIGVMLLVSGGTVLGVLGAFMLLRLPVEWKTARLLKRLRRELPPEPDEPVVVRRVLQVLREPEWAKVVPVQRLQLARSLQATLRQPLPGWGSIIFAAAGYLSPLWVPLLALVPLYGVGVWRVHQAEARVATLVGVSAPGQPAAPDAAAAADLVEIQRRLGLRTAALMEAAEKDTKPAEETPEERAALIALIRRLCARPPFQLGEQEQSVLALMTPALTEEVERLALAGEYDQAAAVIDDLLRLAGQVRDGGGALAFQSIRLMLLDAALDGIERLNAHRLPADAATRWHAALDEEQLRIELVAAFDEAARGMLAPGPAIPGSELDYFSVYSWLLRWPPHRADALERLLAARAALQQGDFGALAVPGGGNKGLLAGFSLGGMRLAILRAQGLGLVCRQRLARAAVALHARGAAPGTLAGLPADLRPAAAVHPLTGAPITLVRDEHGTVLRFGPRPPKKPPENVNADNYDDIDLRLTLDEVEWWLTPGKKKAAWSGFE